jgi:hypothetical protein
MRRGAGILSKFLIPELPNMAPDNRQQLLAFIVSRWAGELKNDQTLVRSDIMMGF